MQEITPARMCPIQGKRALAYDGTIQVEANVHRRIPQSTCHAVSENAPTAITLRGHLYILLERLSKPSAG